MSRTLIAGSLLLASIYAAHALGLGREGLGFGKLGVAMKRGTGSAPPGACDGTIDLSTGCVMPMLR